MVMITVFRLKNGLSTSIGITISVLVSVSVSVSTL